MKRTSSASFSEDEDSIMADENEGHERRQQNVVRSSASGSQISTPSPRSSSSSASREALFLQPSPNKKGRKAKHPVHKYFAKHAHLLEAHCLITPCTYKMEIAKDSEGHAGNMKKHLKHHHKEHFKKVEEEEKKEDRQNKPKEKPKDVVLNGVHMSGNALRMHCLRLITEHGEKFALLDHAAFQDIVNPYITAMPAAEKVTISSWSIKPMIPDFADELRNIVAEQCKKRLVCVKLDGCTRRFRHFLGINLQYVLGPKLVVRTLAVEELMIKASSGTLKNVTTMALEKIGLTSENVLTVTSDNASSYLLVGKIFDAEVKEIMEEEETYDEDLDQPWPQYELMAENNVSVQSVRCAAHTEQLSVESGIKKTGSIKATIDKARALVKYLKNTGEINLQLRELKLNQPVMDVETRWMSTFDMLDSLVSLRDFHDEYLTEQQRDKYGLSLEQWEEVDSIRQVLQPCKKATLAMQKADLLLGDFLGEWLEMKFSLEELQHDLARNILADMEEKEKRQIYKTNSKGGRKGEEKVPALLYYPAFCACIFMDPRFISLLEPEHIAAAKTYLLDVWKRLEALKGNSHSSEDIDTVEQELTEDIHTDATVCVGARRLEMLMAKKNRERRQNLSTASTHRGSRLREICHLLDVYETHVEPLPKTSSVLAYWDKRQFANPELHELAVTVLAIPATQVSVERLFSALKYILNPLRYNLTTEHVDDVAVLHTNKDIVKIMTEARST